MKKILSLLCGLLVLSLVLVSCGGNTANPGTTNATTANPNIDSQTILGSWYSERGMAVVNLMADGKMEYYYIQPGYYAHYGMEEGLYSIDGSVLTFTIDDTNTALTWSAANATLTSAENEVFTRIDVLPKEHPSYKFPDFANMDCSSAITLGAYKGLTPDANTAKHAALNLFTDYYTVNKDKAPQKITQDRAAAYGDQVTIDYVGKLNGEAFQGGTASDQTMNILDNSGYIPGFVEGIIGHKMGETFDVNVTFPKDYHATDLAGQAVVFTMTLDAIYDLTISDADIAKYTEDYDEPYTSYAALLEAYTESAVRSDLWTQITEACDYSKLSEDFYMFFYQYYADRYHSYAFYYGMDYTTFLLQQVGLTDEQLMEESKKSSLPYVISCSIFKAEDLKWTDEQYEEQMEVFVMDAMEYFDYTTEEARKYVLEEEYGNFTSSLIYQVVLDWIYETNTK